VLATGGMTEPLPSANLPVEIAAEARDVMPAVTVVIPSWNGRDHLAECLVAIRGLDYPAERVEILVVDNGSTDDSTGLVTGEFPEVRVIRNADNRGFAQATNQGARQATAPYVAFLNNDTRADPRWLVELVQHLEAHPDVAAAGSLVLDWEGTHVDFSGAGMTPFGRGIQVGYGIPRAAAPVEPVPLLFGNGAAMLVRRNVFLDAGGFDERFFAYYEDVDLGWRLWVLGWRIMLVPSSIVYHRHHGSSRRFAPGQLDALMTRNAVMTAVKNYDDPTLERILPILLLLEARRMQVAPPAISARYRPPGRDLVGIAQQERYADHFGATGAARAGVLALARRRLGGRLEAARILLGPLAPRARVVGPVQVAQAVALGDLLDIWPELLHERSRIQALRKRPDSEIIPLFALDTQQRLPRSARLRSDETTEAAYQALEGVGLDALLPRG
jgi:GT2 family glycosyltransferase